MKRIFYILTFVFLANICQGQDFKNEFERYFHDNDTTKQLEVLLKWEKIEPKNAELFTSYFNYYFNKSQKEVLTITDNQPAGDGYIVRDSSGSIAGYIGNKIVFDSVLFENGLSKINQGIKLYPNRLDMRFGKIFALGQKKDWSKFTKEIIKTIRYSNINNNQWTWTYNKKRKEGKDFLLSSLQTYQLDLFNTGNDDLLANMRIIAEEILKYYPDHIESLTNLSITYLLTGEYDKGLRTLFKAEKLNPTDAVILSNIARGYKLIGNKRMAIIYYEKTIEHGDEKIAGFAKQQLEELQK